MSLICDDMTDAGRKARCQPQLGSEAFRFIPNELSTKCRRLIESYHAMHGYVGLPDMLWRSDGRGVIECCRDLTQIFADASKSRSAKRAHGSFSLIATVILSLEMLARDLAGWGTRFPAAKREAEKLLVDFPRRPRAWLIDMYLYPSLRVHRELAGSLAPASKADGVVATEEDGVLKI